MFGLWFAGTPFSQETAVKIDPMVRERNKRKEKKNQQKNEHNFLNKLLSANQKNNNKPRGKRKNKHQGAAVVFLTRAAPSLQHQVS